MDTPSTTQPTSNLGHCIHPAAAASIDAAIVQAAHDKLVADLDPEDFRDIIDQYEDAAAGAVARFGGHVAKKFGDGLLVYFGWPIASEDDPRACGPRRSRDH